MNEFGQRPQDMSIAEEEEERGRPSFSRNDDTRPAYVRPSEPTPFSRYTGKGNDVVPEIRITHPTFDTEQQGKDDEHAGCCAKCVIM